MTEALLLGWFVLLGIYWATDRPNSVRRAPEAPRRIFDWETQSYYPPPRPWGHYMVIPWSWDANDDLREVWR